MGRRGWIDQAKLQNRPKLIAGDPFLYDPVIGKAKNCDRVPGHSFTCDVVAAKAGPPNPASDGVVSKPRSQPVRRPKDIVDFGFELSVGFFAMCHNIADCIEPVNGASRPVHDAFGMKQLLDDFGLFLIEHFIKVSADQPFVNGR